MSGIGSESGRLKSMANDGDRDRKPRYLGRPKKMFGTGGGFQCWTTTHGPDIVDLANRLAQIGRDVAANRLARQVAESQRVSSMVARKYEQNARSQMIEARVTIEQAIEDEEKAELLKQFLEDMEEDWDE